MPDRAVLGVDTSCYTTSLALMKLDGTLLADARNVLTVKPGHQGLSQSEMVYQHTRNLPELMEQLPLENIKVEAIAVSERPRPRKDSYMPAFLPGLGLARSLAKILDVPLIPSTHQHNHLYAVLWSLQQEVPEAPFLLVHISGGTTDFLRCEKEKGSPLGVSLIPLGTSIDLHAGQFIDRVGVALGLSFPTGAKLETLAEKADKPLPLKVWAEKNQLSLSGPCSAALRAVEKGANPADIALGTEQCIARGLEKVLFYLCGQQQIAAVYLCGGVSANGEIRRVLKAGLGKKQIALFAGAPRCSVDGAVGNAYLGVLKVRNAL